MTKNEAITIPKKMTGGEELVVIPRQEYDDLQKYRDEMNEVTAAIKQGEQERKSGKTHPIVSLDEL